MYLLTLIRIVMAILLALALASPASAHCIVGNRFFPATLIVDDPCVNDELSLPTIEGFKNGDQPSADEHRKPLLSTLNWLIALLGIAFVVGLAWCGHSGAGLGLSGDFQVGADAVHLVTAAIWVGGSLPLLIFIRPSVPMSACVVAVLGQLEPAGHMHS